MPLGNENAALGNANCKIRNAKCKLQNARTRPSEMQSAAIGDANATHATVHTLDLELLCCVIKAVEDWPWITLVSLRLTHKGIPRMYLHV